MSVALRKHPKVGEDGVFDLSDSCSGTHETVKLYVDSATGLRAIVAVHSTARGPALGGTRFFPYKDEESALWDVLRLSEGMTYKAAAAGLPLGGGKAVIIGDPRLLKTPELLGSYGRLVDSLGGSYITAGDVGTTSADMDFVGESTAWVVGRNVARGGSGDSGYSTANGVFCAMTAAARYLWGTAGLRDRIVGVEGAGKVGSQLIRLLLDAGADVLLAEPHAGTAEAAANKYPSIRLVDSVINAAVDVYAPCAMGATLNAETARGIRASIVCGAANNQLHTPDVGDQLAAQETLWVPDYLANAGGLIQVASEIDAIHPDEVPSRIGQIGETVTEVLRASEERGITPGSAADSMVRGRLGIETRG